MPFPRVVPSKEAKRPWLPGAMKDVSHSGGIQIRTTKQVGWVWEEVWGLLNVRNPDHEALMTTVDYMWNRGVIDTITHPLVPGSGIAPHGLGTAGVLVMGAAQTGGSIITDQWPLSTNKVVRSGDLLSFAGDNAVYRARADVDSDGSGVATIPIVPNLRLSPADNAAVTTTGVTFRVIILGRSRFEESRPPSYYAGLTVIFGEMLL